MIEELIEFLRGVAEQPARAIGPLWMLFWLWSVARSWIKRFRQAREREPSSTPAPRPAPAPPRKPPRPAPSHPRNVEAPAPAPPRATEARWPALIERAEVVRSQLLRERGLRWLEPIVVSEVLEPLHAARIGSRSPAQASALEQRASGAALTLQALERVVRERAEPAAASLLELDRIAQAAQRPLSEYARAEDVALTGETPLAVRFEAHPELYARGLSPKLLFLTVPRDAGAELAGYTTAMQALARRWLGAFPVLGEQLRAELGLSDRVRLSDPRSGFDERSAYAAFGPWLPALFAEVALTLRFGDAYVTALRERVIASGGAAARASVFGDYLGAEPPGLLRLHAALGALRAMGQGDEAERHETILAERLPGQGEMLLPLAGGHAVALPTAFMAQLTDEVTRIMLEARLPALGGVPLAEWPGLTQTLEDAREQERLSRQLIAGTASHADAAQLLSAAWLAAEASGEPERVFSHLRKALAPGGEPAPQASFEHSVRGPRPLSAALRDPRTLRNAILIGSALAPRRSARS